MRVGLRQHKHPRVRRDALVALEDAAATIHDVAGRTVRRVLHEAPRAAGMHFAPWNGEDERGVAVGSGVYFIRLETPEGTRTSRLVRAR